MNMRDSEAGRQAAAPFTARPRAMKGLPVQLQRIGRVLLAIGLSASCSLCAQETPTDEPKPQSVGRRYWERASQKMTGVLSRLDNYTCILHMSRYESRRRGTRPVRLDVVRLQVTALGGVEYYSMPGEGKTVTNPRDLISTGLVATGIFQGYAHAIFLKRAISRLEFMGADARGPMSDIRYRFQLDPKQEPMDIRLGGARSLVPAEGDFWLDQRDLLLRRMVVRSSAPAKAVGIREARYVLDWAPVKTSAGDFLLPQRAETWMLMDYGGIALNTATLAQCREYRAESSIRFDLDEQEAAALPADEGSDNAVTRSRFLPGGLTVAVRLAEELPLGRMAVGDAFRGTLSKAVLQKGEEVLPAGSEFLGRVRRLEVSETPRPHAVVWLEISVLRGGSTEYTFLAYLRDRDALPGLVDKLEGIEAGEQIGMESAKFLRGIAGSAFGTDVVPGVGAFLFEGKAPSIPRGYTMTWRTVPAKP